MAVIRTALALAALTMSVPAFAQGSRYGWDRSRVETNARGGQSDNKSSARDSKRGGERTEARAGARSESRTDNKGGSRVDPRIGNRVPDRGTDRVPDRTSDRGGRSEQRFGGSPIGHSDRIDRREESRIVVRPPVVVDRYDRRDNRYAPIDHRASYRYGDREFRQRDLFTITAWFRALPPARLTAYGYYGPGWSGVRYAFRPGIYLSLSVYTRLDLLPMDLEYELGELPWYLERRIYGNTVLVIDTRSRLVVDMFEIDY